MYVSNAPGASASSGDYDNGRRSSPRDANNAQASNNGSRSSSKNLGQAVDFEPTHSNKSRGLAPTSVSGVVDSMIDIVQEMNTLRKEVNRQAQALELANLEIEHLKKGHKRKPQKASSGVSSAPDIAESPPASPRMYQWAASQGDPSQFEATVDAQGKVRKGREVYIFNESVWDASLFLGVVDGIFEAGDMILLGLLNLAIQGYFCALLWELDLVNTNNEFQNFVNDFIQWRIGVAHQAENYDPLTDTSLAQRVCQEYGGTIESRRHQNDYESYKLYFDARDSLRSPELQGPGLLMLSLTLWIALICKEVISIIGFSRMLLAMAINGGGAKTQVIKNEDDGTMELVSLGRLRALAIFCCISIPRLAIAGVLGFCGVYYLSATSGIEDIILNAMALGFVLEIDELLFCFAPSAARYTVSNMNPVPIEIRESKGSQPAGISTVLYGLLERSRLLLIMLVIVVVSCRLTIISEVQDSMKLAQVILCHGDLNFIFKEDPATNILTVANTQWIDPEERLSLQRGELGNIFDGVLQATGLCGVFEDVSGIVDRLALCEGEEVAVWEESNHKQIWCSACEDLGRDPSNRSSVRSIDDVYGLVGTSQTQALLEMDCVDTYTSFSQTEVRIAFDKQLTGADFSGNISICPDMAQFCLHEDIPIRTVIRRFCPQTCKCQHGLQETLAGTAWFFNRVGCPQSCASVLESELRQFEDRLLVGEAVCEDQDGELTREEWANAVLEVEEWLIKEGKLVLTKGPDGSVIRRPSEFIQEAFGSLTFQDYVRFSQDQLFSSQHMTGCQIDEGVDINLLAWADAAGSVCKWADVVGYVFDFNPCTTSNLLFGLLPFGGLCPLTCAVGICGQDVFQQQRLLLGTDYFAWYNHMDYWGEERLYNITCDSSNFMCMKVGRFHSALYGWGGPLFGMPQLKLEIYEQFPDQNATLIYETTGALTPGYVEDLICTRMNASHPASFEILSTGFDDRRSPVWKEAMRWRLIDFQQRMLTTAGWDRTFNIDGYDWRQYFGTHCSIGQTVSVLAPWEQMQQDAQANGLTSPSFTGINEGLMGSVQGMFAYSKAQIIGGYNPHSGTILVSYFNSADPPARVPLGHLGNPLTSDGQSFQDYASCLPHDDLYLTLEVNDLSLCNEESLLTCNSLIQGVPCASTLQMIASEMCIDFGGRKAGVNMSQSFADLCPSQCQQQEDPQSCVHGLSTQFYYTGDFYSEYYSFSDPFCLQEACDCIPPSLAIGNCTAEFFSEAEDPFKRFYHGYYFASNFFTGTIYTELEETARTANRLAEMGTPCFYPDDPMWRPRTPVQPNGPWCIVSSDCFGSFPQEIPGAQFIPGAQQVCHWRAASATDCALDPSSAHSLAKTWVWNPEMVPSQGPFFGHSGGI